MNPLAQELNATTRTLSAPWPFPVSITATMTYANKQPPTPRPPTKAERLDTLPPALFCRAAQLLHSGSSLADVKPLCTVHVAARGERT